jgi:hypothetical protein
MRCSVLPSALATILVTAGLSLATTIRVPSDYGRIQVAIYYAEDGDTVLIADGTYTGAGNRDIDFLGKAIVVMSENGAEGCIVDCEGDSLHLHRGFYFHSGEDSTSVLKGITIRGGRFRGSGVENSGGAILCENSSPTLTGLIIKENKVKGDAWPAGGGGIYCYQSSARILENRIMDNRVEGHESSGGGIACLSSFPIISRNIITGNTSIDDGGGIWCWSSSPVIVDNTVESDTAWSQGGGVAIKYHSTALLAHNSISMNRSYEQGGGIHADYTDSFSSLIIADNTIVGNRGTFGGGINTKLSFAMIVGNTIIENIASAGGGI